MLSTAEHVREHGAHLLRGGAFKPRTSPYEFQGLREEGLKILAEAREATGLPIITEVEDTESLTLVGALRRRPPDRRAQHAELLAARGGRRRARSR